MTVKEKIMKLQTYKMYEGEDTVYVERDDVLKALEQQPCEDCISRAEVLEFLKGFGILHNHDELRSNLIYEIMNLSPASPQPKTGHWIDVETLDSALWHECSECGETEFYATDYCPNCGAKMEVEE